MDWDLFFKVVSGLLAATSLGLTYRSLQLTEELNNLHSQVRRLKDHNGRMREFGRNATSLDYQYVDALILGPRNSGKSSVVDLWRKPWTNVQDTVPSETWSINDFTLHEFPPIEKYDDTFEVDRKFKPVLRIRIRDYPGEDRYKRDAILKVKSLDKRVALVFFLKVGFAGDQFSETALNEEYFSVVFMEDIERICVKVGSVVARVIVVFNKSDLLDNPLKEKQNLSRLKEANKKVIHRFESVFSGITEYILTSAENNHNIVRLLGLIASTGVQEAAPTIPREAAMKALEEEIRRRV